MDQKSYFDLFAGIGLVDYALDKTGWVLDLAVDYDLKKKNIYSVNFPEYVNKYVLKDVFSLTKYDLPNSFLGHASFPCTDVSTAGRRKGVGNGVQSSAIDSVLGLLYSKEYYNRPNLLLTENVKGLLTSNDGKDIQYLLSHYSELGYYNDILFVDAKYFVPQSRQRIFIVSMKKEIIPEELIANSVTESWVRPSLLMKTINRLKDIKWLHLKVPPQPQINNDLESIIDYFDINYWDSERKDYFLSQMSSRHLRLISENIDSGQYNYFTAFRRMRMRDGRKQSTAEIRTDGLAGCLRTAKGGSAKQILVIVGKGEVNVRLLNERECARLMGAPNFIIDPTISKNDYLFGFGDAVCSSAIEFLDNHYLTPIYEADRESNKAIHSSIQYNMNLSPLIRKQIIGQYKDWRKENLDNKNNLPIKGRLYGAMIVLHNLRDKSDPDWSYSNTLKISNTDSSTHFNHRSIQGHTSHRLKLALDKLNRKDLIPTSGGEAGRTSTGTKFAGLGIIKIVNHFLIASPSRSHDEIGDEIVDLISMQVLEDLQKHADLGGIYVKYNRSETVGAYISKLINAKVSKPGAVSQHLVGAKLQYKFKESSDVIIEHHSSSTADVQTNRLGDFDIGNAVIHVTKTPNAGHFEKAYSNANAGRITYILVPEIKLNTTILTNDIDVEYKSKVNVYSIEQFISQNIDEIALFRKDLSLQGLKEVLEIYNSLVEIYENDSSLKIVIPDFGV